MVWFQKVQVLYSSVHGLVLDCAVSSPDLILT